MPQESRIIPDPMHVRVTLQIPDEMQQILRDLHADRQSIGAGAAILIACVVATTWKKIRSPI